MAEDKPRLPLSARKFGDRELVTLDGVKLLSKPSLEIREVKGFDLPQHFGQFNFQVEANGKVFTIYISPFTREHDIPLINSLSEDKTYDLVLEPGDWSVGNRSGTNLFFEQIKEH